MRGRDRILRALRGEKRDRVPIMLHNFMMAAREAGVTMAKFRSDGRTIADCFARTVESGTAQLQNWLDNLRSFLRSRRIWPIF